MALPKEIAEKIVEMKKQRGAAYTPRTRHLDENGAPEHTNRLFLETSPYLLQHAHNPVNWYPWGDEAFETAEKNSMPVLLSVGYATCHWCHVMEEESFEDEEIAAFINENYIPVKVDREERPDVDAVYMSAVQALTGRGGWPMTVWLTPDRKPFYGGTYFPARDGDRGVPTGFLTILKKVREAWDKNPDLLRQTGLQLTGAVRKILAPETGDKSEPGVTVETVAARLKKRYDPVNGGAAGAPKFPATMPVSLLLRAYRRTKDETLLEMAEHTLLKMARGGIYDHAGGGFHRYATDEKWLVPHFEKMLYDNALLVTAYLDGFQATGNASFRQVVDETLVYVQRDMTSPEGGFYSATDADSPDHEGKNEEGVFFTWTPQAFTDLLGEEKGRIVARYFDVTDPPNFENGSILNIKRPAAAVAEQIGIPEKDLLTMTAEAKPKLYQERLKRPAPLRDEKILTGWNGLMISAFARAALVLDTPAYLETARKAARFVMSNLFPDNRLYRSYKDGLVSHKGFLEDYAFFTAALLDLFEADPDPVWIETAVTLDRILSDLFEDRENGGFFATAHDHETMIAREKPAYDGAVPSGNSVAAMNLARLALFTSDDTYRQRAADTVRAFSKILAARPEAMAEMVNAVDFSRHAPKEIVIVSAEGNAAARAPFLRALTEVYMPDRIVVQAEEGAHAERLAQTLPLVAGRKADKGEAAAYVCESGMCRQPVYSAGTFAQRIKEG